MVKSKYHHSFFELRSFRIYTTYPIAAVIDEFSFVKIIITEKNVKREALKYEENQEDIEPLNQCKDVSHLRSLLELSNQHGVIMHHASRIGICLRFSKRYQYHELQRAMDHQPRAQGVSFS